MVFDFDGTIADSFETFLEVFEIVAKRPQKLTAEEIKKLRGENLRGIIKYLKIRKWQIPRMVLEAKRLLAARVLKLDTFPGMPGTLKELNGRGYLVYILSTNSSANIEKFLKNRAIDSYFSKINGDIGLRSKSSALKKLVKNERLKSGDCYYIGDETRDVEAAKKAGLTSIGVTWGFNYPASIKASKPDFVARSPKDLLKILK